MKRLTFGLTLLFIINSNKAFATAQVPDLLVIGNDTHLLFTNPLESYFQRVNSRELPGFSGCGSSACWRNYQAVWTVFNDSLFLTKIQNCHKHEFSCTDTKNADLATMFLTEFKNDKVFAAWFTGKLRIPKGNLVYYIHYDYRSIFENDIFFDVKDGKVLRKYDVFNLTNYQSNLSMGNTDFIEKVLFDKIQERFDWAAFKRRNDCLSHDFELSFWFDKNGKFLKVFCSSTDTSIDLNDTTSKNVDQTIWKYTRKEYWFRRRLKNEIKRNTSDLPIINVIKDKHRRVPFGVDLDLRFEFEEKKIIRLENK